jgi:hypothetical protein
MSEGGENEPFAKPLYALLAPHAFVFAISQQESVRVPGRSRELRRAECCRSGLRRRTRTRRLVRDELLHIDGHFGQRFDSRAVLAQSVLHYAEIEAGDHDVVPSVSDPAQRKSA